MVLCPLSLVFFVKLLSMVNYLLHKAVGLCFQSSHAAGWLQCSSDAFDVKAHVCHNKTERWYSS